jgi:transposase
VVEGRLR